MRLFIKTVKTDLVRLLNVNRFAQENRPVLLRKAAERLRDWLVRRYYAEGFGEWEGLKESTKEAKASRGSNTPDAILREFDTAIESIEIDETTLEVGFLTDKAHRRKRTLLQVVGYHQEGKGKLPARPIIVLPDIDTQERMVEDIRESYFKEYRKSRRR